MISDIEKINKKFKYDYESYGGIELFTKYVMSEMISPIEDYQNVIDLIRKNYHKQISVDLLIIGAYLIILWTFDEHNEMLDILNLMEPYLKDKEKAIIHYLNAYELLIKDSTYLSKKKYKTELYASLDFDVPFVNNRYLIAEFSTGKKADKFYNEALENVSEIFSEYQIEESSLEDFLNPKRFINEFILGICMAKERYNEIKGKII